MRKLGLVGITLLSALLLSALMATTALAQDDTAGVVAESAPEKDIGQILDALLLDIGGPLGPARCPPEWVVVTRFGVFCVPGGAI